MHVLMVYGTQQSFLFGFAQHCPDIHLANTCTLMRNHSMAVIGSLRHPESSIRCMVVSEPRDLEKLRGLNVDVVIESDDFELGPTWDGVFFYKGFPHDRWEGWRRFLQDNVLRR